MWKKVLGLALAAPLLLGAAAPATAQTLDEILTKYYEAIGGLEAWQSLQSLKIQGTMSLGMGMQAPFTILSKRPSRARMEFTVQGMKGVQGTDGEKTWMLMPFMGQTEPQEMPPELASSFRDQADFDGLLVGWKEEGHQVELVGEEEVGGTRTYKLKVTSANGNTSYYYLDAERYLPIRIETTRTMQGQEVTIYQELGDYRKVDGLVIAHSVTIESPAAPGGAQILTVEAVEVNPEVEDAVFAMPAGGS